VMPSGRFAVTRDNAKSTRSMRVMFSTPSYTPAGVWGGPAAMTTLPRVAPCGCAPPRPPAAKTAATARECFVVRDHQSSDDKRGNERRRDCGRHNAFSVSLDDCGKNEELLPW
jgi:hypothetical protein